MIIVVLGVVVYFGVKNKQDSDKKIGILENQIAELKNNNENNNKTANNDMNNENQISNYPSEVCVFEWIGENAWYCW